jgi:hypothetical protein
MSTPLSALLAQAAVAAAFAMGFGLAVIAAPLI